jgi:hypothetical protein
MKTFLKYVGPVAGLLNDVVAVFGKICVFILLAERDAYRIRDTIVNIDNGLRAVRYVARISVGEGDVFLLLSFHTFCGSHPASSFNGHRRSFAGIKWSRRCSLLNCV